MKKRSNRSHIKNQTNLDWFAADSARKARVKTMSKKSKEEKKND